MTTILCIFATLCVLNLSTIQALDEAADLFAAPSRCARRRFEHTSTFAHILFAIDGEWVTVQRNHICSSYMFRVWMKSCSLSSLIA